MSADKPECPRLRLFFALWPGEPVLQSLARLVQSLDLQSGKPVALENLHVTLVFLGDVPKVQVEDLQNLAANVCLNPCELVFDRLEHWLRPAVLCLTASEIPAPLQDLVAALKRGARQLGIRTEKRPFRPHLTLARKVRKRQIAQAIEPVRWPVREFVLVSSELNRAGSVYSILGRWRARENCKPGSGRS